MTTAPDYYASCIDPLAPLPAEPVPLLLAATPETRLAQLQAVYPELKAISEAAAKRYKDCVDEIKTLLQTAAPGQARVELVGTDAAPGLQLDYRHRWTFEAARLKKDAADNPALAQLYVSYAKQGGAWYLNEVKS